MSSFAYYLVGSLSRGAILAWTKSFDQTLHIFMTGEGAKYMETLSTDQVKTDLMRCLRKFIPNLPEPMKIVITRWSSNQNILGSYSYPTVESVKAGVGPKNLAEPTGDGHILFAGEATNAKYFSTVHGAIESGWREADRIISSFTEKLL